MLDYTLVVRVHLEAMDDPQARQVANDVLQQTRLQQIAPQAQLVLRRQGPGQSRNLLGESPSPDAS